MEKLYIVHWCLSSTDDHGNNVANGGVVGAYLSRESAEEALKKDIREFADELVADPEYSEEEKLEVFSGMRYAGCVRDEYFELDYDGCGCGAQNEYRVEIVEKEVQD